MQHYRFVEFGRSSIKHFLLNDWNLQCENIKELYKQYVCVFLVTRILQIKIKTFFNGTS